MTRSEPGPTFGGRAHSPRKRAAMRSAAVVVALLLVLAALFVANGTRPAWRTPRVVQRDAPSNDAPARDSRGRPSRLRVLALNVAKCDFHEGGLSFAGVETVTARLDRIAERLRDVDVVLLSEVVIEAGPCPVDQVAYLADKAGFPWFASGENYSFGLPFYRVRSGNGLLSRLPLRAVHVQQLSGERPFWSPTNNRRSLWCEIDLGGEWLLVGSLRNDSFDLANNAVQVDDILSFVGDRPALIGGDVNAEPDTPSMERFRASGKFTACADLRPTFPARAPVRRIDEILAPDSWRVVDRGVIDTGVSDHLAVTAIFELPPR